MLHRVLPEKQPENYYFQRKTAISWAHFCALLDWIENKKLQTFNLNLLPSNGGIALTFDDGYADNEMAFEEILKRNMTATVFPVRDFCQTGFSPIDDMAGWLMRTSEITPVLLQSLQNGQLKKILRAVKVNRYRALRKRWFGLNSDAPNSAKFLSETQLRHFYLKGISFGVHGTSHRIFDSLSIRDLVCEINQSIEWMNYLGVNTPTAICLPHGRSNNNVIAICETYGIPIIGVDKQYADAKITRRFWVTEDTIFNNIN
jgi:peptidoglycan/xylan/chitin deacetylase (PgdA/CDA1 family)